MRHHAFAEGVTRETLIDWYRATRARTRTLFDCVAPEAYCERPIPLRNPLVFYEGHIPAFAVNTLIKLALKQPGIDEHYETIFARGIDPEDEASAKTPTDVWPSRRCVQEYAAKADELIIRALAEEQLENDDVPELRRGEAVFTILEHELMHQETLLYLVHQLPYEQKRAYRSYRSYRTYRTHRSLSIPAGRVTLGADRAIFGWDNEFAAHTVEVPAFAIDEINVTNGQYLDYMAATGAKAPHFWMKDERGEWLWRGLFEAYPLPLDAPVYVTHDEASAYARWKGARLPTEAEYHRAAEGATPGNYDFAAWDPVDVASFEPSAWGVHDLIGNGWEWTSTLFDGFPGFEPMPSYLPYSTDFFDGAHYVMKGASPVTPRELVRPSFRNWFRPNYPYVYATFRCAH